MAVDLTLSFHVALYLVFLESLLFFAVVSCHFKRPPFLISILPVIRLTIVALLLSFGSALASTPRNTNLSTDSSSHTYRSCKPKASNQAHIPALPDILASSFSFKLSAPSFSLSPNKCTMVPSHSTPPSCLVFA